MPSILSIAELAFLIGDPARANMLYTLKESEVASAGDLTLSAGVAASTASEHLAKLVEAGLVTATRDGRNRYYRLRHASVGDVLDAVENLARDVAPDGPAALRDDQAALHARPCGDHLAGRLGVALTDCWFARGYVRQGSDGLQPTARGTAAFAELGVDIAALRAGPRKLIGLCPDWSEGTAHLGGALGGAILKALVARDWLRRRRGARHVAITPKGAGELRARFDIDLRRGS